MFWAKNEFEWFWNRTAQSGNPKMSADSGITKIADWRVKTLPGTLMLVTQIMSMPTTCYTYLV